MLSGKSVLITGGTGSFGRKFVETVLARYPKIRRLVVFSRDELKQFEMAQDFPREKYPQIRFFIGNVRDAAGGVKDSAVTACVRTRSTRSHAPQMRLRMRAGRTPS